MPARHEPVMLAPVIEFNKEVLGPKTAVMAQAMGLDDTSHESFAGAIDSMLTRFEIPEQLSDIGVGRDRLYEVAHKSNTDAAARTNPRSATVEQIEEILTTRL